MHSLVLSLLGYSRTTLSPSEYSWFDLREVMDEAVSDLDVLISETRGAVRYDELPEINADRVQMRQLFENLIANSLKFHNSEKPEVNISYVNDLTDDFCEIRVKDNGIGFEDKYHDLILLLLMELI